VIKEKLRLHTDPLGTGEGFFWGQGAKREGRKEPLPEALFRSPRAGQSYQQGTASEKRRGILPLQTRKKRGSKKKLKSEPEGRSAEKRGEEDSELLMGQTLGRTTRTAKSGA